MNTPAEFDLDKYLRASRRVDLTGVDWEDIPNHPFPVEHARCLAYMMDIESHTVIYLRDLLATRAAYEPDVTAFLSCWVYEELWHGEAFSRFLGEAGYRLAPDGERPWSDAPYPTRIGRNSWIRRKLTGKGYATHIGTLIGAAFVNDFVAVHMTWGAVNELSTLTSYHRLIEETDHPVLVDVLTRIIKDERRHFAFYRSQARMRLERSPRARKMTRWAMDHLWAPVGTGVRPQEETDFVIAWLFGGEAGTAACREMDEVIRELPGFEDARLTERARDQALLRRRANRREASLAATRTRAATPLAAFRG